MSRGVHPNCDTSDYENFGQNQQDSLGNFLDNADEIDYQKLAEQGVQSRSLALPKVSDQQFLIFSRIFVIAFVDPSASSN